MNQQNEIPKNFHELFVYVNERYFFNKENYPALGELSLERQKIFKINHGILHILKNYKNMPAYPSSQREMSKAKWLGSPMESLGSIGRKEKEALLKTFINIVSLLNSVDVNLDELKKIEDQCSSEKLMHWIKDQVPPAEVLCLRYGVEFFLDQMVPILELLDHKGKVQGPEPFMHISSLYQLMYFWFGKEDILSEILQDIPNVMKSK